MSNYATTYNINQTGDLYAIDASGSKAGLGNYASSTGTTINSPVNYRFLKLFTGLDNEFIFYIKNTDRKPIQLHGQTITANVVNRETQVKLLSKKWNSFRKIYKPIKIRKYRWVIIKSKGKFY